MGNSVKTELQKKSIISALKKTFNFAVMQKIKLSPEDYKPIQKRSKRYNKYQYQNKKVHESCDEFLLKKIASGSKIDIKIRSDENKSGDLL
jgi:hypothetical protein